MRVAFEKSYQSPNTLIRPYFPKINPLSSVFQQSKRAWNVSLGVFVTYDHRQCDVCPASPTCVGRVDSVRIAYVQRALRTWSVGETYVRLAL